MLPLKKKYVIVDVDYDVSSGNSSGDSDSDSSMMGTRKRVQFTVTETDHNNNNQKTTRHIHRTNKTKDVNNINLIKIDRGDIPNGSDIFRQVLKDIQTEDGGEQADVAKRKSLKQKHLDKVKSKPLKSILKK